MELNYSVRFQYPESRLSSQSWGDSGKVILKEQSSATFHRHALPGITLSIQHLQSCSANAVRGILLTWDGASWWKNSGLSKLLRSVTLLWGPTTIVHHSVLGVNKKTKKEREKPLNNLAMNPWPTRICSPLAISDPSSSLLYSPHYLTVDWTHATWHLFINLLEERDIRII